MKKVTDYFIHPKILSVSFFAASLASTQSLAKIDANQLNQKFAAIRSAEQGALFTRISDGKVLYELNADKQLSPASVTKIITSATALASFGPAFTFKTPIYYTGKIAGGRITGDLIIQGNGDPFIVSEVLWQMAIDLRHLGVREIAGNLILDNQLFDSETRDESRLNSTNKSSHAYDAPVSAFAVNFNTVAVATAPADQGKPAISSVTPFPLRHVKLTGKATTVKGDQSASVALSRSTTPDGGISLQTGGVIGEQAGIKKLYRSVGDPNVAAGDYVIGFLNDAGIKFKGSVKEGRTPNTATLLYEMSGYEMRRIAQGLNTFSNNFIADMLTKRMGAAFYNSNNPDQPGSGSMTSGIKVITDFLKSEVGVKSPFTLLNGSGLSIENRISARQINQILIWMEAQGELFPDFLASLPALGWDGTLKKRAKKGNDIAGLVRAKSGTLSEPISVAGLAGYFRHPSEGWVSFVMIGNGVEGKSQPGIQELRNLQDDVLNSLINRH